VIEYSANLEAKTDIQALVNAAHAAAAATGVLRLGGLRTRAVRRDIYRIADGAPENAFVNVIVRIRPRTVEQRKLLGEAVFEACSKQLDPLFETTPLALSVETVLLDHEFTLRRNNLHERLQKSA
jgi:5-carboxymethyl-2-hydroxymuconate isomerase